MMKSEWSRTAAAALAAVMMSATCVVAAVGPGQPGAGHAAVTMAARVLA